MKCGKVSLRKIQPLSEFESKYSLTTMCKIYEKLCMEFVICEESNWPLYGHAFIERTSAARRNNFVIQKEEQN